MKLSRNSLAKQRKVPRSNLPPLLPGKPPGIKEADYVLLQIAESLQTGDTAEAEKLQRLFDDHYRSFQIGNGIRTAYYRVYDPETEAVEMGVADKIRWWFFFDILRHFDKSIYIYRDTKHYNAQYHDWKRYHHVKIAKNPDYRGKSLGVPESRPMTFSGFCEHVKSNGVAYGIFASHHTPYIVFDIDNHNREDDKGAIEKICSIYEVLKKLSSGIVFVEAKKDFTGFHIVYLFHSVKKHEKALEFAQKVLEKAGTIVTEIYPQINQGFRIPFHNQYHIVLDRIVEKKTLQYIYEKRHGKDYNKDAPVVFDKSIYPDVDVFRVMLHHILHKAPTPSSHPLPKTIKTTTKTAPTKNRSIPNDVDKISFSGGNLLPTLFNYFDDTIRGVQGQRWKIFYTTAKIARLQGYSDEEIVDGINSLMDSMDDTEKMNRSWFSLSPSDKEKEIEKAIGEAEKDFSRMRGTGDYERFEKIVREDLRGFRIFDKSTWGTYRSQGKIDTLLFLSSRETISLEYAEEIVSKLKGLKVQEKKRGKTVENGVIPRRLYDDLPDLAVAVAKLCAEKYFSGFGVSIKYFRMMFKDKFGWNPRGGDVAFYELLKALDELEVIEITKQRCIKHKSRVYRMGKRMRKEVGKEVLKKYGLDVDQESKERFYSDEIVKVPVIKEFMPE